MKKKLFSIILLACLVLSLCGCSASNNGASIYGFTKRMNEFDEGYSLSDNGYIIDKTSKTFTKYFTFNKKNLMLKFTYNEKSQLETMSIVSDTLTMDDTAQLKFIKGCIYAFVCDEIAVNSIFTEIDFDNTIFVKDINTKKAKSGNTEMLIDVTELGTVITVLQNTP